MTLQNPLTFGRVRNRCGEFVEAGLESIEIDSTVSIVDSPAAGDYPIASFTLGPGQRQSAVLGYLALPIEVVAKLEDAILRIR
jgi:hypothetical protein